MPEHTPLAITASADEYLEAIYKLGSGGVPVTVPALAESLGVSAASANEMVRKLVERGLADYEPYKGIALSDEGRAQALVVVRRHRLWERFLVDVLEIPWDQVHSEACRLEHATSPLVEEGLARFLSSPSRCPHGHAMPAADGSVAQDSELTTIAGLEAAQRAEVVSVPEEDGALLRYLDSLNLRPGSEILVLAVEPFGGPISLRVAGANRPIGRELAARIRVRCLGGEE
jgi:DtxR family Mn-dependent transcriptional regulator